MGFLSNVAKGFRAIDEGRRTAEAFLYVERQFGIRLSHEVRQAAWPAVARMAEHASVPDMALEYLTTYARMLVRLGDALPADVRERAGSQFTLLAGKLAALLERGEDFHRYNLVPFIDAANALGADTSMIPRPGAA